MLLKIKSIVFHTHSTTISVAYFC